MINNYDKRYIYLFITEKGGMYAVHSVAKTITPIYTARRPKENTIGGQHYLPILEWLYKYD